MKKITHSWSTKFSALQKFSATKFSTFNIKIYLECEGGALVDALSLGEVGGLEKEVVVGPWELWNNLPNH